MKLFSSIKNFFSCKSCQCEEQRVFTQKEVNELHEYWIGLVRQARIEERKACEKEFGHKQEGEFNINYGNGLQVTVSKEKYFKKTQKRKTVTPDDRIYSHLKREEKKHLIKALNKFIRTCCHKCDQSISSELFLSIYKWWCIKNKLPHFYGKIAIHNQLKKIRVSSCRTTNGKFGKKGDRFYEGIRINTEIYAEYMRSKKTQITPVAQPGAPVVCSKEVELF